MSGVFYFLLNFSTFFSCTFLCLWPSVTRQARVRQVDYLRILVYGQNCRVVHPHGVRF